MRKNKRIFAFLLFFAVVFNCFSLFAFAIEDTPDISHANAVCLYNVNTGKNILSKNMQKQIFPAGAVKMMTGLIACEMLSTRLDEQVVITEDMLSATSGNNIKLKAGMSITLENLLYGVLCGGGNDAAIALANVCSGAVDAFVDIMNDKATELGLKNTYFTNPTGIDDKEMYSTLADIMIIAREASKNELYMNISSAMSYVYTPQGYDSEIKFFNRNALISNFYTLGYRNLYAMGMTSGNTDLGGQCVITFVEKNDTSYICAVMGADEHKDKICSYDIANELVEYAFENYNYIKIAEGAKYDCDLEVENALPDSTDEAVYLRCIISEDIYALTYSDVSVDRNLKYRYYFHSEPINAPIAEGDIVGGVDIIYNGEV
ncbi:MAG: D-alanyl-D-alanine carboxypeptidase, partial [Clostridia bacterium]|nr:D-alanyl-D-alanine carboxypeptidase [Clostridia bacterium]